MDPQQPQPAAPQPPPGNSYDFIVQPGQKPKRSLPGMRSPFVAKIVFLVVGVVIIGIVLYIVGNLLASTKVNTSDITTLAQMENEIARIAKTGKEATAQTLRNSARTSELTAISHQKQWLSFLSKQGTELSDDQLALTADTSIDKKLKAAKQNGTFDLVFSQILENELTDYSKALQTGYKQSADTTEKVLLKSQFEQAALLIKQIPEQ